MNASSFARLTPPQQHAMLLAMQIRNAMEDLHVRHLSDAQMAELNRITRQALYDGIAMMENDDDPNFMRNRSYLISMIPDHWEIPGQDEDMQDRKTAA
ncbi:hypothetical protein [Microbacterium sp. Kw_RZR3]|uniref:hypothetical protein n=1 Tax=unclassified Microbacterium TaxID=2609290 RepID=UPI0023DBA5D6|nr:hypothetical protein [Microbacterium sp. Kw_RZR3]MDF2048053.1 hypothetical protein [Microbacterium sp. Kw_RZR3]MDF2509501.1 hypothetical protein [Microbacterium sp.]MDF2919473.1 hypothetical protein [Microbacterium sp.]